MGMFSYRADVKVHNMEYMLTFFTFCLASIAVTGVLSEIIPEIISEYVGIIVVAISAAFSSYLLKSGRFSLFNSVRGVDEENRKNTRIGRIITRIISGVYAVILLVPTFLFLVYPDDSYTYNLGIPYIEILGSIMLLYLSFIFGHVLFTGRALKHWS